MTYCVGVKLQTGLIFASDSRTHAEVDNYASFCKMTVFERPGERVMVLLSSGSLAGTQAVVSLLRQRTEKPGVNLFTAKTMFDVANVVSDAMRDIDRRDSPFLREGGGTFNASFILGGQIAGGAMQLFRIYAQGNFIEAGTDTPFLQTGETKYGKPIIDRVILPETPMADAVKCVLISFDSTMRSNLSVGMPIDMVCYEKDSLHVRMRRRFQKGDAHFDAICAQWGAGIRKVFADLPEMSWPNEPAPTEPTPVVIVKPEARQGARRGIEARKP